MATVTSTTTETEQNSEPALKLDGATPEAARAGIAKGQDVVTEQPPLETSFGVQGFVRVQTVGVPTDMSEADLLAQIEAQQAAKAPEAGRDASRLQQDLTMDAADDRIAVKSTNASVNRELGKDEFGNPIYDDPSLEEGVKVRTGGNDSNANKRRDGTSNNEQSSEQELDPELNAQTGSLDATVGAQEKILTVSEQLDDAYDNPLANVDIPAEVRSATSADVIAFLWIGLSTRKHFVEKADNLGIPMNNIVSFPRFTEEQSKLIEETGLRAEVGH